MNVIDQVEVGMQLYCHLIGPVIVTDIDYYEGIIHVIESKSRIRYLFDSNGQYIPLKGSIDSLVPDVAKGLYFWNKAKLDSIAAGEVLVSIVNREIIVVDYCSDFIYTICRLEYDGALTIGMEKKAFHYRKATDVERKKMFDRLEKEGYKLVNNKLIKYEHNKPS